MGGAPVDRIYVFFEADVTVAERHGLIEWITEYDVELELIDGETLAELLTDDRARWIAERYLDVAAPEERTDPPTYDDFVGNGVQAGSVHGGITINQGTPRRRPLLVAGLVIALLASAGVVIWAAKAPDTTSASRSPRPTTPSAVTPSPRHPATRRRRFSAALRERAGGVYADPAFEQGSTTVSSVVTVTIAMPGQSKSPW